jgi:hypothetical protein
VSFSVLAIICARDEMDILPFAVRDLQSQDVDVYLMDDGSTDGTWEAAQGWDLAGLELYPLNGRSDTFDLREQLKRKEEIASQSQASWIIHADADELRRSPRSGETVAEALRRFDADGFNACDHTLIEYLSRDGCVPGMGPEFYLTEAAAPIFSIHVKAWKNVGRVDLATSGGHSVQFQNRRIAAEKLILKHYPLRGSAQSARKLADRRARWNPEERELGWHVQYDNVLVGESR